MKTSAGLLIYRRQKSGAEIFLVHPGGPFWRNKDTHAWSIPKGEMEADDEEPLIVAKREFREETGQEPPSGEYRALEPVKQSGKRILAFAIEGSPDPDIANIDSNTFTMEWPPKSGREATFPEIDAAAWVGLGAAREKIHKGQAALLDQLERLLEGEG